MLTYYIDAGGDMRLCMERKKGVHNKNEYPFCRAIQNRSCDDLHLSYIFPNLRTNFFFIVFFQLIHYIPFAR